MKAAMTANVSRDVIFSLEYLACLACVLLLRPAHRNQLLAMRQFEKVFDWVIIINLFPPVDCILILICIMW